MTKLRTPSGASGIPAPAMVVLVVLRTAIGWHFLYEGVVKLADPAWTAAGFLRQSQWILSGVFQWIAETPAALRVVDFLNLKTRLTACSPDTAVPLPAERRVVPVEKDSFRPRQAGILRNALLRLSFQNAES